MYSNIDCTKSLFHNNNVSNGHYNLKKIMEDSNKVQKKLNKQGFTADFEKCYKDYSLKLTHLKEKQIIVNHHFDYPFLYFYLKDSNIYFVYNKELILNDPSSYQHFLCNTTVPGSETLITNFFSSMINYLTYAPPFFKLTSSYAAKELSPFPLHQYITINNQLYFIDNGNYNLVSCRLTSTFPHIKKYSRLHRYLFAHSQLSTKASIIPPSTLFINAKNCLYSYDFNSKIYEDIEHSYHLHNLYYKYALNLSLDLPTPCDLTYMYKYFYQLCSGNYNSFVNLCLLVSSYFIKTDKPTNLFLIRPSLHYDLQEFYEQFNSLLEAHQLLLIKNLTISSFSKNAYPKDHAFTIDSNRRGFYILPSSALPTDKANDIFRKIVNAKKYTTKDTIMNSISCINHYPVVALEGSHVETIYLKNNFTYHLIDFTNFQFDKLIQFDKVLDQTDSKHPQIKSYVILYLIMLGKYFSVQTCPMTNNPKKTIIPHDDITSDFISKCTIASEDEFIYADELYNAYLSYFHSFYKGIPLKRIDLIKQIKRYGSYEYKRPHKSRNISNKYAFTGITLKASWLDSLNKSDTIIDFNEENFINHINNISFEFKEKLSEVIKSTPNIQIVPTSYKPS